MSECVLFGQISRNLVASASALLLWDAAMATTMMRSEPRTERASEKRENWFAMVKSFLFERASKSHFFFRRVLHDLKAVLSTAKTLCVCALALAFAAAAAATAAGISVSVYAKASATFSIAAAALHCVRSSHISSHHHHEHHLLLVFRFLVICLRAQPG